MNKCNILISILVVILIVCCVFVYLVISFDDSKKNGNKLILTCDLDTIKFNQELVCTLKGQAVDYDVTAVVAKIKSDDTYELTDITPSSSWQGDGEDGFIALYTDEGKSSNFNVATFKISLIDENVDEIEIKVLENSFTDANYEEHKIDSISKKLVVKR